MKALYVCFLMLALTLTFTACDKSSSSPTSPTTSPSAAPLPTASVAMEINSPDANETPNGLRFNFSLRLRESGGVAVNIDTVRAEVRRATGELEETVDLTAAQVSQATGSNRLPANQTRDLRLQMVFRATIKSTTQVMFKVLMTDDNRHALEIGLPYSLQPTTGNFTGTWAGSAIEGIGGFAVYWVASQNGNNVSGPVTISGFNEGTGRGTISGNRLDFSFSATSFLDGCRLSWSGSLTINGNRAEGRYSGDNCYFGSGSGQMSLVKL